MVLIEEFNGYENLKKERDKAVNDGFRQEVISAFDSVLLDYRRAHNIYEVGDWVIPIKQPESEFFHAVRIDRIGLHGGFYDTKWRLLNISKFRHATDAEIEAGRRL